MASALHLIDSRYLYKILDFLKNNRPVIVNLMKGKCLESTEAGYKAMERRIFSRLSYSLGYFWSVLGIGLKTSENKDSTKVEKTFSSYIEQAEAAIERNNLEEAESLLEEALVATKEVLAVGITCIYDMLATLAFRQGNIEKAEKIVIQVVEKLLEKGFSSSHNTVVNYKLKLARIYSAMGRDKLAEEGFRNCLTTQKRKYSSGEKDGETTLLWLNVLFWYGKFLTVHERYAEAKQCFESAYTLSADLRSIDSQQAMVMLYHLGEVSYVSGMEDEALKYLMNGVILGRAINSKDVPSYCAKIGLVYFKKGIYDEAKKWAMNAQKSAMSSENIQVKKEAEDLLKKIVAKTIKHPESKMKPSVDPIAT